MKDKLISIAGTGVLLTAGAAGIIGLNQKSDPPEIPPGTSIYPEMNDGGSFNLINIDLDAICSIANLTPQDDYLFRLSSLIDAQGKPLFSCDETLSLLDHRIDIDYIEKLAHLNNPAGKNFFRGEDIISYHQADGTVEYAEQFASMLRYDGEFIFRGNQMAQLYALRVKPYEMLITEETPKPNALLIYPVKDNEYGVFRNIDVVAFHNQIKEAYDVTVKVAAQEQEVYGALDASKNVELLILFGHGIKNSLSLGESDLREAAAEKDETYTIDTSDKELEQHLKYLHPSAAIFLYSCLTGSGREKEENLANAVAGWAGGRMVIAPEKILHTGDVQINDLFPFNVTLFYQENYYFGNLEILQNIIPPAEKEDITYVAVSHKNVGKRLTAD